MADKYCPLQSWSQDKAPVDMKCKKEKCVWWIRDPGGWEGCAIKSIALDIIHRG